MLKHVLLAMFIINAYSITCAERHYRRASQIQNEHSQEIDALYNTYKTKKDLLSYRLLRYEEVLQKPLHDEQRNFVSRLQELDQRKKSYEAKEYARKQAEKERMTHLIEESKQLGIDLNEIRQHAHTHAQTIAAHDIMQYVHETRQQFLKRKQEFIRRRKNEFFRDALTELVQTKTLLKEEIAEASPSLTSQFEQLPSERSIIAILEASWYEQNHLS